MARPIPAVEPLITARLPVKSIFMGRIPLFQSDTLKIGVSLASIRRSIVPALVPRCHQSGDGDIVLKFHKRRHWQWMLDRLMADAYLKPDQMVKG
jgi:hypothetical protein